MSLRSKIVLILVGVVVLYAALDNVGLRFVADPIFEQWERDKAGKDLDRVDARIEQEKENLSDKARIYASLPAIQEFALDPTLERIHRDLGGRAMESAGVSVFFVCDEAGQVLWGRIVDPTTGEAIRLRELPAGALSPSHRLLAFGNADQVAGLMMTERWPLLVSSHPISDAEGRVFVEGSGRPLYGTVILGRFLDPEFLQNIGSETGATVAVRVIGDPSMPWPVELINRLTGSEKRGIEVGADGRLHALSTKHSDLRTGEYVLLDAAVDREITARGKTIIRSALVSTLLGALLILFVLLRLLLRIVIKPLSGLTTQVIEIGKRDDTTIRVALARDDEIGQLSGEFDKMLEKLARSREQVVQTARLAGRSEIATGVLHNVGNVLNSVNVSSNMAAKKAGQLSVGDLEMLVSVLQRQEDIGQFVSRDPRGKHLVPFLGELARSLGTQKTALQDELSALSQGIEHIAELVRAQQSYAGARGVFEKAGLAEQVEAALKICQQGLHESGDVEIVREFGDIPAVKIDKHKLMEILVNLINNAAQALADGGRAKKRMTLRIARVGADTARIEVEDDGVGIPRENLTKIFHHGFTTKKNGHGFGLHVSANAATEMKAKLHARSDGPGRGATFTLDIPLEEAAELVGAA